LEEKFATVAAYRPRPQARYLANMMTASEKSLQDTLSKLMSQLESIERKVDEKSSGQFLGLIVMSH
jgi:hypothetical protein